MDALESIARKSQNYDEESGKSLRLLKLSYLDCKSRSKKLNIRRYVKNMEKKVSDLVQSPAVRCVLL